MWRYERARAERRPVSDSSDDDCGSGCHDFGCGWRQVGGGGRDDSDDGVDDAQAEEDAFLAAFFEREEAGFDILADADA